MLQLNQVKLPVGHSEKALEEKIRRLLSLGKRDRFSYEIRKRSIDARRKPELFYVYQLWVKLADRLEERILSGKRGSSVQRAREIRYQPALPGHGRAYGSPVVIGAGPAGLFCAFLLTEFGFTPRVFERGRPADQRRADVERFWETGVLDPCSNVQFGEGGAGTFSDGKLNTGVKDMSGRIRFVLETFVRFGAPADILVEQKPHIGTDILAAVVMNMRLYLEHKGCRFYFETQVVDFQIEAGRLRGLWVRSAARGLGAGDGRRAAGAESLSEGTDSRRAAGAERPLEIGDSKPRFIEAEAAVLAIGHSARDTFGVLDALGVPMEAKSFAAGFRVEHPQSMIDEAMYGRKERGGLPAAPYKVTAGFPGGRGVYSFCMCPGGYVVAAASGEEQTVVNGMSYSGRSARNANSAIIVSVTPEDFGGQGPLAGVRWQESLERRAWLLARGRIPQQLFGDFCENKKSSDFGDFETETKGQRDFANLRGLFSEEIEQSFMAGMRQFGGRLEGFDRADAILSGVESRTSSPVRILRGEDMQSDILGLYPCGEGAGYAGGITSAAVDGLKIAEAVARQFWENGA